MQGKIVVRQDCGKLLLAPLYEGIWRKLYFKKRRESRGYSPARNGSNSKILVSSNLLRPPATYCIHTHTRRQLLLLLHLEPHAPSQSLRHLVRPRLAPRLSPLRQSFLRWGLAAKKRHMQAGFLSSREPVPD